MDRVTLYTVTGCRFCAAMRAELERRAVAYTEIDVARQPERVAELVKLTRGRRIVPVVVEAGGISVAPGGGSTF
jgi:glutaredoxin